MSRVALVTGAARGIGAATVIRLVEQGWNVVAVDIGRDDPALPYPLARRAELEAVAATAPERITPVIADVRDLDALRLAVTEAERRWGGLDAAVAAAGVIAGGLPQHELPLDQERVLLEVNLVGVLNLARVAVPALLRRPAPRSGRFVAVASAAAASGLPQLAAYCASKAGVVGLVRALAAELGPAGITANAVSPGSTATAMLAESARLYDLDGADEFVEHHPIGRLVQPVEVAEVIAFLAGTGAGAITGAVVPVDGGMTV